MKAIVKYGQAAGEVALREIPEPICGKKEVKIEVKALDQNMQEYTLEASGFLARAFSHENDHLNGILYTEKVEGVLEDVVYEELDEEEVI